MTMFRDICNNEGSEGKCKFQEFTVHNNSLCGGTIGALSSALLNCRTIDIGAPMLAMHSIREMMAVEDVEHTTKFLRKFIKEYDYLK